MHISSSRAQAIRQALPTLQSQQADNGRATTSAPVTTELSREELRQIVLELMG